MGTNSSPAAEKKEAAKAAMLPLCNVIASDEHNALRARIVSLKTPGEAPPLPSWEGYDELIVDAVHESTGLSPGYFKELDRSAQNHWLRKAVSWLHEQDESKDIGANGKHLEPAKQRRGRGRPRKSSDERRDKRMFEAYRTHRSYERLVRDFDVPKEEARRIVKKMRERERRAKKRD